MRQILQFARGVAAPLVDHVGVDPVRHRDLRHRGSWHGALGDQLRLDLCAVASPGDRLGLCHGCPPKFLVDTILSAYAGALKGGIAGRLRTLCADLRISQDRTPGVGKATTRPALADASC